MSELVRCRGLSKSYPSGRERIQVLQDLELVLERGEMVAVLGQSGVGKSTLLHLLGCLDHPDGGDYLFDGRDVFQRSPAELARFRNRHVGFVFQFHHLLPEFSALENVLMPRLIRREHRRQVEDKGRALLEEMGLADRMDHRPSQLSGGEQQRVAIARALMADPELLLADEPTGNLDPRTSVQVFEVLRKAHDARGLTTLVASHNERLSGACDRSTLLAGGRLEPLDEAGRRAYYSPGS
jgi:lipoprotein-releasing system ATP-binding protein